METGSGSDKIKATDFVVSTAHQNFYYDSGNRVSSLISNNLFESKLLAI